MGTAELPRITGTELELCVLLENKNTFERPTGNTPREILKYSLPSYLGRSGVQSNYFVTNGARVYVDIGDHIEYATPEDDSLWGTVANELALEKVISDTLDAYVGARDLTSYRLHKRVIDKTGVTWGYHENYYMPKATHFPTEQQFIPLIAHLATRQIFTGAGYQRADGTFKISQKITTADNTISASTTHLKPLINSRDEPHTGGHKNIGKRLHVVSGDPNMSPWATFMKLATTSLVLRLVEENTEDFSHLIPKYTAHGIASIFCGDVTLKRTVEMQDGRYCSALNIQEALFEKATKLAVRTELPEEEKEALTMWEAILTDLRLDIRLARSRVDWIAKYDSLQRFAAKHSLSPNDPKLQGVDWRWDLIGEQGVGKHLRKTRWQPWVNQTLVTERVYNPPSTTRAFPRSLFVSMVDGMNDARVNWDSISLKSETRKLTNPRNNSTALVESLFPKRVA